MSPIEKINNSESKTHNETFLLGAAIIALAAAVWSRLVQYLVPAPYLVNAER